MVIRLAAGFSLKKKNKKYFQTETQPKNLLLLVEQ